MSPEEQAAAIANWYERKLTDGRSARGGKPTNGRRHRSAPTMRPGGDEERETEADQDQAGDGTTSH